VDRVPAAESLWIPTVQTVMGALVDAARGRVVGVALAERD
jgi:hypothetical protein